MAGETKLCDRKNKLSDENYKSVETVRRRGKFLPVSRPYGIVVRPFAAPSPANWSCVNLTTTATLLKLKTFSFNFFFL